MNGETLYELSFFIYLAYACVSKWSGNSLVNMIALVAVGVAALYELLFLLIFRRKNYVTLGRCVGLGFFYTCLVIFIMFLMYFGFAFMRGASIAGVFSLEGFFEFFALPVATKSSFGGLILLATCLIYMFIFIIVTRKKALKSPF